MSSKGKGTRYERELIHMFYNEGYGVLRSAGSGSTPLPSPDIIVSNGKKILAIECKSLNSKRKYFPEKEINELKIFSERFGAIPLIGIRFDRIGWYFVDMDNMGFSKTNYYISLDLAQKKGLKFEEIIGKYKQMKL
jgi:holliday junction resolvase Hjr